MAAPSCTDSELLDLVKQSGYPFELTVAESLLANGFQVRLSQHFYNPLKQKDSELDILATKQFLGSSRKSSQIKLNLELAIECKDNALPYVLFGFPPPQRPSPELIDFDYTYIKVRSTVDDFPNKLSMVAFGDIRESQPRDLKPLLHQFSIPIRFHHATQVQMEKGKLKLHESEHVRSVLGGLAGYSEYMQDTWLKSIKLLKERALAPMLWITFYLVIHNGQHFRYFNKATQEESGNHFRFLNKAMLERATHTTLLTSFNSDTNSSAIAIDFVEYNELAAQLFFCKIF